ncbi:hypothetical protein AB1Y20_002786 [Prymnesium parvum]|uniref:Sugar phosphate transporter domain-containing protein n=1 Tax=Prymnesium parvum TaxID=97485 RepID=A0AB34JA44_PRYPA
MRHARHAQAQADDSASESSEEEVSAEEDQSEEELLIADPAVYQRSRQYDLGAVAAIGGWAAVWCVTSVLSELANRTLLGAHGLGCVCLVSSLYMIVICISSRLLLLCSRRPPLAFQSLRLYLLTVGSAGVLTSLEVTLTMYAFLSSRLPMIIVAQASTPCWQLLFSLALGWESPRSMITVLVPVFSAAAAIAAFDHSQAPWNPYGLLLCTAALPGARRCLLQRILQENAAGAVPPPHPSAHPWQVMYAMSPWTIGTAALAMLFFDCDAGDIIRATHLHWLAIWITASGCLLSLVLLAEFHFVAKTCALSVSIVGVLKEVFAVAFTDNAAHGRIAVMNVIGAMGCLLAWAVYVFVKYRKGSVLGQGSRNYWEPSYQRRHSHSHVCS